MERDESEVRMTCDEAGIFVSALCDGETIPRAAAEHLGCCAECQARMRSYTEIGVELRRIASVEFGRELKLSAWRNKRSTFGQLWQKGWETMRIPRLAFALMLAGIIALSSTLLLVKVRARSEGTVVMLKVVRADGVATGCPLSTQDKNQAACDSITQMNGKIIGYQIKLEGRDGNRVELGVRSKMYGEPSGSYSLNDIEQEPQKRVWFEPGETLKVDVAGAGTVAITGEWMDHMPVFIGGSNHDLDPGADEVRVVTPVLLRGNTVVGDVEGGIAFAEKPSGGVDIYLPGEGRFILSRSQMQGAVSASVSLSRITFKVDGQQYTLLTGAPVTRSEHLWVLRQPDFKPLGTAVDASFIGAGELIKIAPEVVVSGIR